MIKMFERFALVLVVGFLTQCQSAQPGTHIRRRILTRVSKSYIEESPVGEKEYVLVNQVKSDSSKSIYRISAGIFFNDKPNYISSYRKLKKHYVLFDLKTSNQVLFPKKIQKQLFVEGYPEFDPTEWVLIIQNKTNDFKVIKDTGFKPLENIDCTDRFDTIKIGKQTWMSKNLNVSVFRNGDSIFHAGSNSEWIKAGREKKAAWCYYGNDVRIGRKYGRLYNWYAINDKRGLAPKGWKIADREDWEYLVRYYGGWNVFAAEIMSKSEWLGTHENSLDALPGGGRFKNGKFDDIGNAAYFWTFDKYSQPGDGMNDEAYCVMLSNSLSMLTSWSTTYGASVRCIKKSQ